MMKWLGAVLRCGVVSADDITSHSNARKCDTSMRKSPSTMCDPVLKQLKPYFDLHVRQGLGNVQSCKSLRVFFLRVSAVFHCLFFCKVSSVVFLFSGIVLRSDGN